MKSNDNQQSLPARIKAFMIFRVIHVDDSPHRISLGVAIGIFTAFLPFLGLHTISALLLAFITRANKAVAVLSSWVNNPFTVVPIFVMSYLAGRSLVGFFGSTPVTETVDAAAILEQSLTFSTLTSALTTAEFWSRMAGLFGKIGLELVTGCLICGTTLSICAYFIMYKMIAAYRIKHKKVPVLSGG